MMVRISILALAFGLGSLTDPSSSSSLLVSAQHLSSEETNAPQRRRRLKPNDNVGEKIKEEHAKGSKSAKFTIATKIDVGSDGAGSELDLDVMELESAVTDDTIIEIRDEADGTERSISSVGERFGEDSLATILATDPSSADGQDGTFALLAVDLKNDEMHGFVDKKGKSKPFNIKQEKGSKGGKSMAEEETDEAALVAPDWSCGVQDEFEDSEAERRLDEHNHSHHDHHDHHHHDHDHQDDEDTAGIMESLSSQLRGANIKPIGKRVPVNRDLQYASTGIYDYQVDIFLEIDNAFITKTGGSIATATNYINLLVSAANVIYEKEIHTHLHVSQIVVSTLYDSATGTSDALSKMRTAYASSSWHTPNIDLHHALLGNSLGGGIAYVGVLCNSNYGFGLTASINGNFVSLSNAVTWDLKAFAHEVGHNFNSGHTHDAYDPVIDTCGTSCPSGSGSKWSTLMSYCQHCTGSYNNIMYTFGGLYDGSGTKSDISNWFDNPELMANASPGRTSVDPRREAHRMYEHATTRSNNCLARADPTPQPTPQPTFSPKPTVFQVPVIDAAYDSTLKAPKCSSVGSGCDSKSRLVGRSSKGPEPNQPNTIASSCADGTAGSFHSDESNDSIKVVSVGGGALTEGTEVKIEATVWAWSASSDHVDFWYTSNVNGAATSWTLINTVSPTTSGALNTVSATYTLPTGGLQAVRVVMRYQGSAATACPGGSYDDADDLVFAVGSDNLSTSPPTPNPTPGPTPSPTNQPTNPPTPTPTNPVPTSPPTDIPTWPPTKIPTGVPTETPTTPPPTSPPTTPPPTSPPTSPPTNPPTNPPPTNAPTNPPTPVPTNSPTNPPTPVPTNLPTNPPTPVPTNSPTNMPTTSPTNAPTSVPTNSPTNLPTTSPTNQPTPVPTNSPTDAPTDSPTEPPPTYTPTTSPTPVPTYQPTNKPTKNKNSKKRRMAIIGARTSTLNAT